MRITTLLLIGSLSLGTMSAQADAPLSTALELSVEQAHEVKQIQARYRKEFAATRGDYNRESRALRRARGASDAQEIARLEQVTEQLAAELSRIRAAEDAEIRAQLDDGQQLAFEAYIAQRQAMVGSSRDARIAR